MEKRGANAVNVVAGSTIFALVWKVMNGKRIVVTSVPHVRSNICHVLSAYIFK